MSKTTQLKPIFTTLIYATKDNLKLSVLEYCLVDIINRLSNTPKYPYCLLNQKDLAENLGISTRQTIRLIQKLIDLGYLEQEPTIKKLRATQKWIGNTDIEESDKMSDEVTKCHMESDKMSDETSDKMSDPIYNKDIYNKDNNKDREKSVSYLKNLTEEELDELSQTYKATPNQITSKAEDLYNYCQAHGKRYKNYRAFLLNAVKKDFGLRPKVVETSPDVEISEEQRQINLSRIAQLKHRTLGM